MSKAGTTSSTATMARRKGKDDTEGLTEEEKLWKLLDFFPSPPWSARAGAEIARDLFPAAKIIREPACGQMHMAGPLGEYFPEVWPSDVHAHGPNTPVKDWLDDDAWGDGPDCDLIMTNPPFGIAEEFVVRGLRRARLGVGLLLRTVYVESEGRHLLFENPDVPLTQIAFFSERVPMTLGKWEPGASSATSYSWFFWGHGLAPQPPRWIAPGAKLRLTKRNDAMVYGFKEPLPLFPEDPGDVI